MTVVLGRGQKYHAKRCAVHVPSHASLKECRRFGELLLMERAGVIRHLEQQVRIPLCGCAKRPLVYVADFRYEECRDSGQPCPDGLRCEVCAEHWPTVIEDAKGVHTPTFILKRHLLADQGVEIRLT